MKESRFCGRGDGFAQAAHVESVERVLSAQSNGQVIPLQVVFGCYMRQVEMHFPLHVEAVGTRRIG